MANSWHSWKYRSVSKLKGVLASRRTINRIVQEFNNKNVIFTVTGGRTGTDTLSKT